MTSKRSEELQKVYSCAIFESLDRWYVHLFVCLFVVLIQDTAGSERYKAMSRIYYRGAKAAVVCYGK